MRKEIKSCSKVNPFHAADLFPYPLKTSENQFPANLVTFTEEILNRKLHFLCSESYMHVSPEMKFHFCQNDRNQMTHAIK